MFKKRFKIFRIIREQRDSGITSYRIEQKYTILFFIHWWGTPAFAPPRFFSNYSDAYDYIREQYPNSIIDSNVSYDE